MQVSVVGRQIPRGYSPPPVGCPAQGRGSRSTARASRYAGWVTGAAPKTRDEFLAATLGELAPYWLDLRCAAARCTKVVCTPLKLMARRVGAWRVLRDVIARLKCEQCGERPARVTITETPIAAGGQHIAPTSQWSVVLVE